MPSHQFDLPIFAAHNTQARRKRSVKQIQAYLEATIGNL